jgi:hypothetical protein
MKDHLLRKSEVRRKVLACAARAFGRQQDEPLRAILAESTTTTVDRRWRHVDSEIAWETKERKLFSVAATKVDHRLDTVVLDDTIDVVSLRASVLSV